MDNVCIPNMAISPPLEEIVGKRFQDTIENFSALLDISNDRILIIKTDGTLLEMNEVAARALNSTSAELVGMSVYNLLPPKVAALRKSYVEKAIFTRCSVSFEDMRNDCYIEQTVYPVIDSSGEVVRLIIMARDITERKQSEARLRQFAAEQKIILDNIASAVFYLKKRMVQWANRSAAELFGYALDEMTGKDTFIFYPDGESFETLGREAYLLLARGKTYSIERQMKKKGGELIWCSITGQAINPADPEEGSIWLLDDITERRQMVNNIIEYQHDLEEIVAKRTMDLQRTVGELKNEIEYRKRSEEKLIESENRYRTLFEQAGEGIMQLSENGDILSVNESFARMHGYSVGEIMNKTLIDLDAAFDPEVHAERVSRIIEGENLQFEVTHRHEAGHTFPIEVAASIIVVNGKRFFLSFHRDITEKRRMEEITRRNNYLAVLGQLSAGIAHEINNPNSLIMSNTEMLQDIWRDLDAFLSRYYAQNGDFSMGGLSFPEIHEHMPKMLRYIIEGSMRINNIVSSLKDYASPGRCEIADKVAINDAIRSSLVLINNQIKRFCDNFQTVLDEEIPYVVGNRQALEQVIINLTVNALQSLSDRNKKVSISTWLDSKENCVIIDVRDDGVGMLPVVLENVFNPFYTTKHDKGGMGLGLSISQSIVKNHSGSIYFKSEPGKGTTATVRLPALNAWASKE